MTCSENNEKINGENEKKTLYIIAYWCCACDSIPSFHRLQQLPKLKISITIVTWVQDDG
jgi:hypothetical protein